MSLSSPHGEMPRSRSGRQLIGPPRHVAHGPYRKSPAAMAEVVEPVAGIGGILHDEDIVLGMTAKGKRSALAKIADRLGQRVGLRGSTVLAALLRRERLGSTAIGHGVAVPHARLQGLAEPAAMLTVLERPIWYGGTDDDPVDLLLTLLWPKDDVAGFLPALASCCRLLRQPDIRTRLRESVTPAEVRAWICMHEGHFAGQPGIKPLRAVVPRVTVC
jgi:PTS system nitrogen regulatory IIA component